MYILVQEDSKVIISIGLVDSSEVNYNEVIDFIEKRIDYVIDRKSLKENTIQSNDQYIIVYSTS